MTITTDNGYEIDGQPQVILNISDFNLYSEGSELSKSFEVSKAPNSSLYATAYLDLRVAGRPAKSLDELLTSYTTSAHSGRLSRSHSTPSYTDKPAVSSLNDLRYQPLIPQ